MWETPLNFLPSEMDEDYLKNNHLKALEEVYPKDKQEMKKILFKIT